MAENRIARELEKRDMAERPKQWRPPELLPEPDKQPGYAYRWIRTSFMNQLDVKNHSSKLREGWEPVPVEEQPNMKLLADPNSRFSGLIEVSGLLLCKCPEEFVEQQQAYYAKMNSDQARAVEDNFMRQSDPRMPLFREGKSSVSFGKGK